MINLQEYLPGATTIFSLFSILLAIFCSGHAILYKSDSRAAIGWVGIIWLVPILGSVLYFLLGINRVRRLAKLMREDTNCLMIPDNPYVSTDFEIARCFPNPSFITLAKLGNKITGRPLLNGNKITPLVNGDEAFPRMLDAIENATKSISLSTYIFDNDQVGKHFIKKLSAAVARGVKVKVLIDDIGLRYSWRPVLKNLKAENIAVARFMGALRPMTFPHFNLRKHRKIMVVDGILAFTGGMNIRQGHQLSLLPKHPVMDLHFEVTGPLVTQLQEVFMEDWAFTTKQVLKGSDWLGKPSATGTTIGRVITEGPDEDLFKLSMMIEGALSSAQDSIWILTPYFLPDSSMTRALYIAASKGVSVNIILPSSNNLPFVQWASNPQLLPLIQHGCNIWFTPPPFDHTKLILVDDTWVLFGSANLDPRSLRLNFELNVECYDEHLARNLKILITEKLKFAHNMSEDEMLDRTLPVRLRDGVARLFSPYL
ncbi:MAG TPA: phospholipase D-like domain-containing protein [Bacteriovoracaceae bacterium]|nr:phospholipase D-like domain-containing protein [Bacteriovoracaceae bacterium]